MILLSIFCVARIYRNSLGYESEQTGGIWNIISLFFFVVSMLAFFKLLPRYYLFPKSIILGFIFTIVSQFNCFMVDDRFSISYFYNFLMIGFFNYIMIVFFVSASDMNSYKQKTLTMILIGIISSISFISLLWFRSGKLSFSMVSNSYYALCLLPFFLFLVEKTSIKIIAYIFTAIIVIFSGKRLGLIAFVIFLIINTLLEAIEKNKILEYLKLCVFIFISFFAFSYLYSIFAEIYDLRLLQRMTTIFDDGGSGRNEIYSEIWTGMNSSSLISWIIGHGYGSSANVILKHSTAHDDFLEILYDYGLISLMLFILYYVYLIKEGVSMRRSKYKFANIYIGSVVISILLSLFSTYCVSYAYVACGMAFHGFLLGKWYQYKEREIEI